MEPTLDKTRSEISHTFQSTVLKKLIMVLWLHIPPLVGLKKIVWFIALQPCITIYWSKLLKLCKSTNTVPKDLKQCLGPLHCAAALFPLLHNGHCRVRFPTKQCRNDASLGYVCSAISLLFTMDATILLCNSTGVYGHYSNTLFLCLLSFAITKLFHITSFPLKS